MSADEIVFRSPASVLQASSVALVGASERGKWPQLIFASLREFGYAGRVFLVNPRQSEVYGERCFPSLRALPEPVEHALVIVPAAGVADVLTDAKAAGVKSATIYAGAVGDGEDPESQEARRLAQGVPGRNGHAPRRPQLHGGAQLPGAAVLLSEHGIVQRPARLGRLRVPVGRHAAVLAAHRRRPGLAVLLRDHVGQRGRSRSRRLSQLPGRRSAHPHHRAVHRRHQAARRRSCMRRRARSKPASRSWRSRPAPPPSRKRRRSPTPASSAAITRPISPCASATASQLPLARRHGGDRARLPGRPAAERAPDRLRHHLGRHGRSVVRLRRARGRRHRRISRAATNTALLPFLQDSIVPKNPLDLGIPSTLEHAAAVCEVVARDPNVDMLGWAAMLPSKPGAWDGVAALRNLLDLDRQAGDRLRPHELSDAAGIGRRPGGGRLSVPAGAGADAAGHEGLVVPCAAPGPATGDASARAGERSFAGHARGDARALRHHAAAEPRGRDGRRGRGRRRRDRVSGGAQDPLARHPAQDRGRRRAARSAQPRGGARGRRHADRGRARQRIRVRASTACWCRRWCRESRRSWERAAIRSTDPCC